MNTTLSVDEYDLLGFFDVMPTPVDRDISWTYNDSVYEVSRNNVQLTFALVPACRDVRIKLAVGGLLVYELNAMGITDVEHHQEKGRESLEVVLAARDSLWIKLKPEISINHNMAAQS
uniref:Uncharacterized protein n=1 Tax=Solibacter usitatus (strain Ellin6076) TaxID=234267 RepID=Q01Q79_SOLUE